MSTNYKQMNYKLNKLSLIASIVITAIFISCEESTIGIKGSGPVISEDIELAEVTGIKSEIAANIYLTHNNEQSVSIKAQKNIIDNMQFTIQDGMLTIYYDRKVKSHKDVNIYISIDQLNYVNLIGSGEIKTTNNFVTNIFAAKLSGSGSINIIVDAKEAESQITGSGDIRLTGNYEYLEATILGSGNINCKGMANITDFSIDGSGNINAFNLTTSKATSSITGSGNLEITANNTLDVNISGSGNVYYKGYPTINSNISGSGKVKDAN